MTLRELLETIDRGDHVDDEILGICVCVGGKGRPLDAEVNGVDFSSHFMWISAHGQKEKPPSGVEDPKTAQRKLT